MPASYSTRVVPLTEANLEATANALSDAFDGYPLIDWFLRDDVGRQEALRRKMFRVVCAQRAWTPWPGWAVEADGRIVAGLVGELPGDEPGDPRIEVMAEAFAAEVSQHALEGFEQYEELKQAHRPGGRHYFLTAVGVIPDYRGQGLGRRLIDRYHALAEADPEAVGVALDTQVSDNVAVYEHLGYHVTAEAEIGPLRSWYLFRPIQG